MRILLLLLLSVLTVDSIAAVKTQEIFIDQDGKKLKLYLAYDEENKGKRPGILVVHEWWGHNDYARMRAEKLAELGYVALALDMYGDGQTASHPKQAGAFSSKIREDLPLAKARFQAAKTYLQNQTMTDAKNIAAIGYCFGGAIVLEMARQGLDLKAVASFHGSLATKFPARAGKIKAKVLVLNGADDKFVSADSIAGFKQEMQQAGVSYEFINYPGAVHAFTNPQATEFGKRFGIPLAYNAQADEQSWQKMQQWFQQIFSGS